MKNQTKILSVHNLCKYELTYEVQQVDRVVIGKCKYAATSKKIAIENASKEISRRFKGAKKFLIY